MRPLYTEASVRGADGEKMMADPTDAELDEMEQDINALIAQGERRYDVHPTFTSRLIKALRACRQQAKGKDAVGRSWQAALRGEAGGDG